jgi:hypothetical protein
MNYEEQYKKYKNCSSNHHYPESHEQSTRIFKQSPKKEKLQLFSDDSQENPTLSS